MGMSWNPEEREILEALDTALRDPAIFPVLDSIASRVVQNLQRDPSALLAWDTVPRHLYQGQLPQMILSSWVFVLRAGAITGAERHPNSHQRMMSWRGNGDFQVWYQDKWRSHCLLSDPDAALERRWVSIPVNVWH